MQYKSQGVFLLLCVFLGGIGIHRFYVRDHVVGVIMLLFCWTFIPLGLAVIEFFLTLFQSRKSWDEDHNLDYLDWMRSLKKQADAE